MTKRCRSYPRTCLFFVRISATHWVEGGLDQSVQLANHLRQADVDLIDVASGGLVAAARIPVAPGYQVLFACFPLAQLVAPCFQVTSPLS